MLLGGEEQKLSFEKFPYTANSVTYCTDVQVAGKYIKKSSIDNNKKIDFHSQKMQTQHVQPQLISAA